MSAHVVLVYLGMELLRECGVFPQVKSVIAYFGLLDATATRTGKERVPEEHLEEKSRGFFSVPAVPSRSSQMYMDMCVYGSVTKMHMGMCALK